MSAPIDDGGPAFPHSPVYVGAEEGWATQFGMTLRDYFAAKAMQAEIISSCSDATPESAKALIQAAWLNGQTAIDRIASNAYLMADAMLKARDASDTKADSESDG